ncbi:MAG TPA: carbohydrate porin [Verrucomicrobiae bacterium]|nr:carbohydrate porin [Verrucomicrobiae bacterium]
MILLSTTTRGEEILSNSAPTHVLLLDSFGRTLRVSTNEVPEKLLPKGIGLERQMPTPIHGVSVSHHVLRRADEARDDLAFQFFPSVQPPLMPYLASADEFGNTAVRPGGLLSLMPLEPYVQDGKYWLSGHGFRYSLEQTINFVNMTDVMQGDSALGFYTFDLQAKWAIFDAPHAATAGWISTQIEAKTGLGDNARTQNAQRNLESLTDPTGIWSSHNGFRIPELAWQQSFNDGEVVVVAGVVSQGNYFDGNAYANSGRGQFMNSALIDTMIVPLPDYNFGLNLQWQPNDEWYAIVGGTAGNARAGVSPWTDFDWNNWSAVAEIGYLMKDLFGLGPGVYRVQPFLGQSSGSPVETGIGFNFQQQLGKNSPFGWFGRFGTGGHEHFDGDMQSITVGSQIGTGFVMQAPLKYLGLAPRLSNDVLGLGFVWSHIEESTRTIYHSDEYVLETFYTLQLSPLARLQPDVQILWNPAYSPDAGPAAVFQLQFILSW